MERPEADLIRIIRDAGIDFTATLPCEKIRLLLEMLGAEFFQAPLTREEEGVGICAGAALAGKRPAMFVQSSGIGNMINALLSLTGFYELPLAIFVSQRGVYQEKIAAQVPMGTRLPDILDGARIAHSVISSRDDFRAVGRVLRDIYERGRIHAFLMSPAIWDVACADGASAADTDAAICLPSRKGSPSGKVPRRLEPRFTRYEILAVVAPLLEGKAVVCNLGFPAKELFALRHRPSHFYMLGSMGMATPIGLGMALSSDREVVVIDGDGSILMNPGTLATAAHFSPGNLSILAIDNGAYGSTGGQPTLTGSCVDLEQVARGFGIRNTIKAAGRRDLATAVKNASGTFTFIHAPAVPGNRDVPNIPLSHLENKKAVMEFLAS